MRRPTIGLARALPPLRLALVLSAACLALALAPAAASAVRFQHESFPEFEHQLAGGQIKAATFNKKAHTLHLTLNDGRHMLVSYPSHEEPQLAAKLQAKGVAVTVEKKKKKAKTAVHHKLRYIAGGILIVVIIVVGVVLMVDRRRRLNAEGAPAAPPSAGDSG
jgi:ATP-dependent Zn protease